MSAQNNLNNTQSISYRTAFNNNSTKENKSNSYCCTNCTHFFRKHHREDRNFSRIRKEHKIKRIAPPHRSFGFLVGNDNILECM